MKTTKKVITISFITIAIILLIAFGIKTNRFNINKTTTPVAQHRNALRVDAEEIQEVSYKWLINRRINYSELNSLPSTNINFTIPTINTTFKRIYKTEASSSYPRYEERMITYTTTSDNMYTVYGAYHNTTEPDKWYDLGGRVPTFETQPNGNLYTWLNTYATPCYNGDAIIAEGTSIHEIRKDNLQTDYTTGGIMVNDGVIQIFLDAGTQNLRINGTTQTNLDGTINITNNDIVIVTTGTKTGNVSHVFTINYFNTRPEWVNPPYPDPGQKTTEVLDITGLMFEILTMPFSFITQAFNVTLWEGTPYQFNFSNFILSLIAIATLIFIIKLFTSGFSVISNYTASRDNREFKRSQIRLNNSKTELNNRTDPNHKTRESRSVNINHNYKHKE